MKTQNSLILFIGLLLSTVGYAQNPIIQTYFTADKALKVNIN
ncbi:hypothetical protein [uncultured Draconibacterium sp.]|nr:hypothetical protein [uncultured Draconibacterium sp.]